MGGNGGADTGVPAALGPVGGGCTPGQSYEAPRPMTPNATLVKGGYAFTEGPTWVAAQQAFYFTEFTGVGPTGRIHRYDPVANTFSILVDNVGVNGMALTPDGALLGAAHFQQRLLRFDPVTGDRTEVPGGDRYMNRPFNSINDVIVRSDGNIYFTDPTYQQGNRPGQDATGIYHLSTAGTLTRLATSAQPNGVALSPDGLSLYVTSVGGAPVRRLQLTAEGGATGAPTTFIDRESEGVAIDCAGNVYLTTEGRVRAFSPTAGPLFEVGGFPDRLTNLGFGGPEHKTLYITARPGSLYKVEMNIPGYPN